MFLFVLQTARHAHLKLILHVSGALINFDCEAHEDIECTSNILDLRPVGCGSRRVSSGPCPFPPVCAHAVHAAAMWNYGQTHF